MSDSGSKDILEFIGFKKEDVNSVFCDCGNLNGEYEYFYRGHTNKNYFLEPAIFRQKKDLEYKLYHYIFQNNTNEFRGLNSLDILSKMQHNEISTRLLDVTKSPSVAGFFSVSGLGGNDTYNSESQPEIIKLKCNINDIKNYDSDTAKILSHLPLVKPELKDILRVEVLNYIIVDFLTFKIVYKIVKSFEKINGKEIKENINAIRNYVGEFLKKFICLSHDTIVFQVAMHGKDIFFTDFFKKDETIDNLLNGIKVFGVSSSESEIILSLNLNNNKDMEEVCKLKKLKIRDGEYYLLIPSFDSIDNNLSRLCKSHKNFSMTKNYSNYLDVYSIRMPLEDGYYSSPYMEGLHYQISQDYPIFYRIVNCLDLLNGIFINPCVTTDRMRAQQGAFMLFGLSRYWNVLRAVEYLEKKKFKGEEILEFLAKNERLTESSLLKEIDLKDFENYVFGIEERYELEIDRKEVIDRLKQAGITKQSLGCDLRTTYYQFLEDGFWR